jgi:glycosyltransferase involved in cell wall biosynthesis
LALWAQRRAHAVPAPVRRIARRALSIVGGSAAPVGPSEDWSVPLVAGRGSADVESLPRTPAPPPEVSVDSSMSTPIRCVVAIETLDVGGMDEMAAFLGRRLPEYGIETTVVYAYAREAGYAGEAGRLVRALESAGVPLRQLGPDTAADFLASYAPDVISAHGAPGWLLDAAVAAGVPWVETLHGMHHFLHRDSWLPERERSGRISAQIAVSDLVRRQYLARIPSFPAERLVTVPNGVDEQRITTVDPAAARSALGLADEFLFLSLARFGLQKNTYGLVTAFAEVAAEHPGAHLLIAGRADDALYYEQVRMLTAGLPCADRIHLRGHCANPTALLAAADAFVLDSFFEGWSLASMEALASGLPSVLSDVGGAREQLSTLEGGYLVANPAGDAELLDWDVISDLRFRPQGNHAALVRAMSTVVREAPAWAARRSSLAEAARAEFPSGLCLRRHAEILRAVALKEPVPHFV